MHKVVEDIYVCSALFVAIVCIVVFTTTIPRGTYRLYEYTLLAECVVCTPYIILESSQAFRHRPRTLGFLAVLTACCKGVVFAFGFHYLWNYSTFGFAKPPPEQDYDLIESLVGACCIALGLGYLNAVKKHVCLPKASNNSLCWRFMVSWSPTESMASLQCEAGVGLCLMMLITDWRRRRVLNMLVMPQYLRPWMFGDYLVFTIRFLTVPILLRFLYTMNLSRLSSAYSTERRVLTLSLGPLAMLQICVGAWVGLSNPPHQIQTLLGSAYLALLMLGNFLLNLGRHGYLVIDKQAYVDPAQSEFSSS